MNSSPVYWPALHSQAQCAGCSYASWAELVLANVDYVVDGLTLQLKQPGKFPAAPRLLAALFQHASLTPALLPALTEPATCALQGLSILSRRRRPHHARPLLLAVHPVLAAAAAEGQQLQRESAAMADTVKAVLSAQQDALFAELRALDPATDSAPDAEAVGPSQRDSIHDACAEGDGSANQHSARAPAEAHAAVEAGASEQNDPARFFEQYHGGAEGLRGGGAAERRERASKYAMPAHDRDALQMRMGRVAAASELAASACETAAPLLLSEDLATCVAAHATVKVRALLPICMRYAQSAGLRSTVLMLVASSSRSWSACIAGWRASCRHVEAQAVLHDVASWHDNGSPKPVALAPGSLECAGRAVHRQQARQQRHSGAPDARRAAATARGRDAFAYRAHHMGLYAAQPWPASTGGAH